MLAERTEKVCEMAAVMKEAVRVLLILLTLLLLLQLPLLLLIDLLLLPDTR